MLLKAQMKANPVRSLFSKIRASAVYRWAG